MPAEPAPTSSAAATPPPAADLPPAPPTEYRVHLESFEGPLDLLLYLIRRAEVDIHDIPIAVIAEQFIGYLKQLDDAGSRVDIDTAGEFLVMAGTLVEIKSRMIQAEQEGAQGQRGSGGEDDDADEGEDPRAELVRQLLAYKRYRDAADALEARREEWAQRFPAARAHLPGEAMKEAAEALGDLEIEDIGLWDLVEAFGKIIASVNFDRLGEHEVISDDTPIELHAEDIVDRLRRYTADGAGGTGGAGRPMTLRRVLQGRTRAEMVGLFLALLDLIRNERVGFRQGQDEEGVGDEIVIELREEGDGAGADESLPE